MEKKSVKVLLRPHEKKKEEMGRRKNIRWAPEVGGSLSSRGSRKPEDLRVVGIIIHLDGKTVLSISGSTKR